MKANSLNLLSAISSDVEDALTYLVAQCRDYKAAVSLCMQLSKVRRTQESWSDLLGMSKGTLCTILNGSSERRRTFDPDLFPLVEKLAGNRAITQFFELQSKNQLNHQNSSQARINELEAELAVLRRK